MPRRLTEQQSAEVLRKALELQSKEAEASMTEQSLRDAARELGIEERHLEAALLQMNSPELRAQGGGLWGGPSKLEKEVVVQGVLTDDNEEDLIHAIREAFEEPGTINRRGETLEWIGTGGGLRETTITLRPSGDHVRIKLLSAHSGVIFIGHMFSFLLMLALGGMVSKAVGTQNPWLPGVLFAVLSTIFLLSRWNLTRWSRKEQMKLSRLVDTMESMVSSPRGALRDTMAVSIDEQEAKLRIDHL